MTDKEKVVFAKERQSVILPPLDKAQKNPVSFSSLSDLLDWTYYIFSLISGMDKNRLSSCLDNRQISLLINKYICDLCRKGIFNFNSSPMHYLETYRVLFKEYRICGQVACIEMLSPLLCNLQLVNSLVCFCFLICIKKVVIIIVPISQVCCEN